MTEIFAHAAFAAWHVDTSLAAAVVAEDQRLEAGIAGPGDDEPS